MIYVFSKNKIFSYMISSFIIVMLVTFGTSVIPNKDVELVKVSANSTQKNINNIMNKNNSIENNINIYDINRMYK